MDVAGQAVPNGVLMRSLSDAAVAVRRSDGVEVVELNHAGWTRNPPWNAPIIRGVVIFAETVYLALAALALSADDELSPATVAVTIGVSLLLVIAVFKLLPFLVATQSTTGSTRVPLVEVGVKVGVLVLYLWLVGQMEEIQRMWRYHGAEHKALHAYQQHGEVSVDAARNQPKEHPGCGTSFLLYVLVLSFFAYWLIPVDLPLWRSVTARVALLPVIAGVTYEVMKIARWEVFTAPGRWLQWLTTKEPGDDELRVAVAALKRVT